MDIKIKKSSLVVMGLFTALGLSAVLVTAPRVAMADPTGAVLSISNAATLGWGINAAGEIVYVDSVKDGDPVYRTGWLVTDTRGQGQQRYWFNADGTLAVDELIDAGGGWYAYARPEGYVVRGKYDNGKGRVYLADNNGKLAEGSGWKVTGEYDRGVLQRYYLDPSDHAARSGYFTDDGKSYFGLGGQGYVLRGVGWGVRNDLLFANNHGVLSVSRWEVTDVFGQGLQRYWFDEDGAMARGRLVDPSEGSGWWAYATDQGYVVRGVSIEGSVKRVADNDGRIANGWLVTDVFSGTLERYWQENGQIAADRLIKVGNNWWSYATSSGAVVRGRYAIDDKVYFANNDGRLEDAGWLISSSYGHGLQRYYIDADAHAAILGFSDAGYAHFTTSEGYVARGKMQTTKGTLIADNEGVLAENYFTEGMQITDKYDGELQRYCFKEVDGHLYAAVGFFQAELEFGGGSKWFYADPTNAYVIRGKATYPAGVLVADNDGVLIENENIFGNWCVTDKYDGTTERYYLTDVGGHLYAKAGLFTARLTPNSPEMQFYGLEDEGYVARNTMVVVDGSFYLSNNDGALTWMSYASQTRDKTLAQVTWSNDYGYLNEVKDLAEQYGSKTNWFIAVDDKLCRVVVLQRSGNLWNVEKTWNCNGGRNAYRWIGDHEIVHRNICNWADEYFGLGYNDWSTCFIESYSSDSQGHLRYVPGKGYEDCASFHSTGYTWTGWDNGGCIGLLWDNAKWIYDTIPDGTNMCLFNPRQ